MTDLAKTPFVRELASSDKKIRDKATDSLALFLRSKTDLSLLELLKLWKGLFFCFYHSDRPLTQQALARNLSYSLVPSLPRSTVHRFLRAFWITIGREFHSIDRLRLDKYLLLIRSYVGVAFQIFLKDNKGKNSLQQQADGGDGAAKKRKREESTKDKKRVKSKSKGGKRSAQDDDDDETEESPQSQSSTSSDWSDLKSYLTIIAEGPLNPLNFDPSQPALDEKNGIIPMPHGPDGLRYHLLDIWIDELEKVLEFNEQGKPVGEVPIDMLLEPVETLRKEGLHKPVRARAAETLGDERLVQWGFREGVVANNDEGEESSEEEWGGFGDD
ncbi:nucleolar protein,Nop52-domain-containing protein [Aspergillus pseudoustus]|uniref:Nucleolar protein,Nop52-domain-containing protein n=1 Tax=Aspergillus pseudoustus TaxID=1810923 RepID=A0ABR4J7C0_9EURO